MAIGVTKTKIKERGRERERFDINSVKRSWWEYDMN
jgi:hypothetical protein